MRRDETHPGGRSNRSIWPASGLLLVLAWASIGCGETTPSAAPVTAAAAPIPQEAAPVLSKLELDDAIAVRTQYGLRADLTWIRAVAANMDAQIGIDEFGIPLMPDELADLMSRRWDPDLQRQVREYGLLFPDDFAGAFINMKANGVIVAFKNDVERHRAALSNLVPAGSVVEVRKFDWSLADLRAFVDKVEAEKAWFDSIGVIVHPGENGPENTVDVRFKGPEEAAGLIEQLRQPGLAQGQMDWRTPMGRADGGSCHRGRGYQPGSRQEPEVRV
jgi:hypothetical protein